VLISNCPYHVPWLHEHALASIPRGRSCSLLCTGERFAPAQAGHLRRVHVLAERLQDMHDANCTGKKAGQSQVHAWFVFDQDCGPATINPVSIHRPTARMPWAPPFLPPGSDNGNGYHGTPGTSRR
jgi:hypothetical protein